jgi:hypothetical protein
MLAITLDCDINTDRTLLLQLPDSVAPGRHRIALVIDPESGANHPAGISPVSPDTPPRTALWERLEALRNQAREQGEAPEPMSWDAVLAEVQRRRGESDE